MLGASSQSCQHFITDRRQWDSCPCVPVLTLYTVKQLGFERMCVNVCVNCSCEAPAINQVGLGSAAERGPQWATHPAGRSGEIQCP